MSRDIVWLSSWGRGGPVLQARIGHAHAGEYYAAFNILETIDCPCGTTVIQMRAHIFRECPLFADHRHILCKASAQLDLSVLLGTTEGIRATTKFIAASGAFLKQNPTTIDLPPHASPPPHDLSL